MSNYQIGIYRKKVGKRLGKYVFLRLSEQPQYTYELLYRKKFSSKFFKLLYETKGDIPHMVELFNYSWYEEKFYDKYEFVKVGTIRECDKLEEQRQQEMKKAREKKKNDTKKI